MISQWNLALVLHAFFEESFEPVAFFALKFLSWKTVFLIALASARHVSCLYALLFEPNPQQPEMLVSIRFGWHKTDSTIFTNPAFADTNPAVADRNLFLFW